MLIFSTLKMYSNFGNFGGPVLGPVPNLGPVLILGPWDRSGPDRLQTLISTLVMHKFKWGMFCCIAALSFLLVGTFHTLTLTLLRLASFAFFRFRFYLAPEMTELESLQIKKRKNHKFRSWFETRDDLASNNLQYDSFVKSTIMSLKIFLQASLPLNPRNKCVCCV